MKHLLWISMAAAAAAFGCSKHESPATQTPTNSPASAPAPSPAPIKPASEVVATIHWAGTRELAGEPDATNFMRLWGLPESRALTQQTIGKLALAPWHMQGRTPDTNAAALLKPLLADCLDAESWMEVRQAGTNLGSLAFAIRLDDARATLWSSNLNDFAQSILGVQPSASSTHPGDWTLERTNFPERIDLARIGDWTVLGGSADKDNPALNEMAQRIRSGQPPAESSASNGWLTVSAEPRRLAAAIGLPWHLPANCPKFAMSVRGDGTNAHTEATLDFPQPLTLTVEEWSEPLPLLDESIGSFSAARGFSSWLEAWNVWTNLQIGPPPNQACAWSLRGAPMATYFAAPLPEASNEVSRLTDLVLRKGASYFATNELFVFAKAQSYHGLEWHGNPYTAPFVSSLAVSNKDYIFAGFFDNNPTYPVSPQLLKPLDQTNLLFYGWEMTGVRSQQWLYLGQYIRFVSLLSQLPADSASLRWLKAVQDKLGDSVTRVTLTGPSQLTFTRRSTIGLTGLELQLLADWLESSRFPMGLHTFDKP